MSKVKFGDIVKDVKFNVDRDNNPYEFYVAGDHMDSEDLNIRRRGRFATDDVGPAFTRIFKKGQVLYGSRRTYLKKVAVADFDGICANTTFVFESKDPAAFEQRLLPFLMLSEGFTNWSIAHSKGPCRAKSFGRETLGSIRSEAVISQNDCCHRRNGKITIYRDVWGPNQEFAQVGYCFSICFGRAKKRYEF